MKILSDTTKLPVGLLAGLATLFLLPPAWFGGELVAADIKLSNWIFKSVVLMVSFSIRSSLVNHCKIQST
jgi:hypothetical protein